MQTISNIADALGLKAEHVLPYGHYKAKISLDAIADGKTEKGKLVVVTGITPTPAGEGKTTTAIGLTQGMGRLGHNVTVNLREPTLGPIFGIKGGGTGGGNARIVPEDEINIHFTGDAHAVASAITCWRHWWTTWCSEMPSRISTLPESIGRGSPMPPTGDCDRSLPGWREWLWPAA